MKITVITPSYNQGQFIGKCISSVKEQSKDVHIEHIILDNCSDDSTVDEINAYKSNPGSVDVKFIIESDEGQTSAINKGLEIATGDIVCWLNTDEWYDEGSLKKVVTFFTTYPDVDVLFGDCDFTDPSGSLVKEKREYFYSKSMLLYYGCYIPSCSTFIRRRVIDAKILLDTSFKVTMDFEWYVHIAKSGYRFHHIPVKLASFTWHDTNISSNFVEQRLLERRKVQDRYSSVIGPTWFRTLYFGLLRFFWIFVRRTYHLLDGGRT